MAKLLLADDHAMVRAGLRSLLETSGRDMTVEEADNATEALHKIRDATWDALILDISMPGNPSLEMLKRIHKEYPELPILVLSMYPEKVYGVRAIKDGAMGYLCKTSAPDALVDAVTKLLDGKHYISPALAERLAINVASGNGRAKHHSLSDREYEVLCLIAAGKTPSEIAAKLNLSAKTIHTYRTRILNKLELKNSAELIRYAYQHQLID